MHGCALRPYSRTALPPHHIAKSFQDNLPHRHQSGINPLLQVLQLCPLRNIDISKIINACQTISHQTICPVHQVLCSRASLQQGTHTRPLSTPSTLLQSLAPVGISYQASHSAWSYSLPSGINLKAPLQLCPLRIIYISKILNYAKLYLTRQSVQDPKYFE